jgi:magnesium chelatase family protein
MRTGRTSAVALTGIEGHLVTVEADITGGLPATIVTGLPGTALREARDRIRAAIVNSGQAWPSAKITIGLSPASLPKRGSAFDLAIAVAILAADEAVPEVPDSLLFLAELGLDGRLRPVPGVLPAVLAATQADRISTVVVAAGNRGEASLARGVTVVAAGTLAEVVRWLRGGPAPQPGPPEPGDGGAASQPLPDMADVAGQPGARLAAEVSAAGGHHLSMLGERGTGRLMLAERLPSIMPQLGPEALLEVASVRSVAGPGLGPLTAAPPLAAPHHTCSLAAMIGGGAGLIRPGAVSLAHRGVLLLDQTPQFHRDVLDALRQPLEAGAVVISRAGTRAVFPARFTLVLVAGPCPCGEFRAPGGEGSCACSAAARRRYLGRLSGPLLDRIDLKVRLRPVSRGELLRDLGSAESSAVVAQRVAGARERAAARLAGMPWRLNAEVPGTALRRAFPPGPAALAVLDQAMETGQVSVRGADKVVRVAWTLADLAGQDRPGLDQVNSAIRLWLGVTA